MLDFRGFSAWITSDGLELVEFESRVKDNTVTCWVAGTANKVNLIRFQGGNCRLRPVRRFSDLHRTLA